MPAVAHDRPGISVPGGDLDIERVHPGIQPVVTKVRGCGLVIGMLACCANCRRRRLAACRSIRAPRDRWLLIKQALYPQIDEQITARLTESEAWRYEREHSREVLQQRLRAAQHAGHDLGAVIDQITAAPMDRARSISSVLHGHLQRLDLPDLGHDVTAYVARCPDAFRAWSRAGQPLG